MNDTLKKLRDIYSDDKIFENHEKTKLDNYEDLLQNNDKLVCNDDLGSCKEPGFSILNARKKDGKLYHLFAREGHGMIVAGTRFGKTTSLIEPTINVNACKEDKPSMFINDPKGELFNRTSNFLKEKGYDVYLINLRDSNHSEHWNFLTKVYDDYVGLMKIKEGNKNKEYEFRDGLFWYDDVSADSEELMELKMNHHICFLESQISESIEEIASILMPISGQEREKSWSLGARSILVGYIYAMLESIGKSHYSVSEDEPFCHSSRKMYFEAITRDNFSLANLISIIDSCNNIAENGPEYFANRPSDADSIRYISSILLGSNAAMTKSGFVSTLKSTLKDFVDVVFLQITSCSSLDIEKVVLSDKPSAIYLCYKDESPKANAFVNLFISRIYSFLIHTATRNINGRLKRPYHFIIDEFGNLPQIEHFDNCISACGGRNIWFLLSIQSYAQLYNRYGKETGQIIKDNMSFVAYMGSNDYCTKETFSKECGQTVKIDAHAFYNGKTDVVSNANFGPVPLVTISRLSTLSTGECYVIRSNDNVLRTMLERSFLCKEFMHDKASIFSYECTIPYDEKFKYTILTGDLVDKQIRKEREMRQRKASNVEETEDVEEDEDRIAELFWGGKKIING